MKKKIMTFVLSSFILVALLCGCQENQEHKNNVESTVTPMPLTPTEVPRVVIKDVSSIDLVADMNIGWNLGNTLDAIGGIGMMSETSWGNPKTRQEMIDKVLDAGFNVIRIPVTWEGHFGAAPEYKIHEIWLARVKEVVDYAYNKGAYVILNTHHEEWYMPTKENKEANAKQLAALWTQIANYFENYDEHLIFEGLNEPRLRGTPKEWSADETASQVINYWEQVFVDTVRATGGNNELRHLMITGYAASSSKKNLEAIVLPEDDKLIVSVHAYTPYDFALNTEGTSVWDVDKDKYDIDYLMETINALFISKGIPVIIGEFGAMNKENEEERMEWVTYYLTKAREIGVPCVWWDNNAFVGNGENFGLLDRRKLEYPYPKLLEAMMKVVYPEE